LRVKHCCPPWGLFRSLGIHVPWATPIICSKIRIKSVILIRKRVF